MPRYKGNAEAVMGLIRQREVHRDVYIDEEVFQLEMDHLFANTWVYVGHDSQIPNAGDYFGTTIGSQPVLMVRHGDGSVHVLFNRCPHQGGPMCEGILTGLIESNDPGHYEYSRAGEILRCPWHGWEFDVRTGQSFCEPSKVSIRTYPMEVAEGQTVVIGPYVAETVPVTIEEQYVVIDF